MMKAMRLTNIGRMELADVPVPELQSEHDVLLKVDVVGVCGSDVHYYETGRIGDQIVDFPFIVGHECVCTAVEVGNAVTTVKAGDRVVVDPAIFCGQCDQCLAGRENTCRNLKFLGCPGQVAGCLCEYIVMPQQSCFVVPANFDPGLGVLCEPLAIGLYAARLAEGKAQTSAILGAGPIGLSCLICAQAEGIEKNYVTDKIDGRVNTAKNAGAGWAGNPDREDIVEVILKQEPKGVDAVFECAGQQETIDQAIKLLKPGGRLMLIGIPRTETISLDIHSFRRHEITIYNVRRQNKSTGATIELVRTGRIDPEFMITHRYRLEQTKEAFDRVAHYSDGVIKALIEIGS